MDPWLCHIGQAQHRLAHLEEGQGGADAEALAELCSQGVKMLNTSETYT